MVHATQIDSAYTPLTRAPASFRHVTVTALSTPIRVTIYGDILDVGNVCLVKVVVQCLGVMTQRSTDEFGSGLSTLFFRLDEFLYVHVRLNRGLYALEVIQRDPGKVFHGYIVYPMSIASLMKVETPEETQVLSVPFGMVGFPFQTDDGFVVLDVGWKGHAYTPYWMIDDAVDEEGEIGREFAHPCRIRYLIDGQLHYVDFSDMFEKGIKVLAVGYETGFVQASSAAIAK